ncbi:response regulator transcription factor [Streptomyces sp. NPDC055243]|uniref:response regulator transcription factor n=1 Tax=Streptomyces sp. NPDC055243 TaxID=3365720 RepID=UPI0037D69BF0
MSRPAPRGLPADRALLTPRRLQVLRLAANGHSNADIGRLLWISEDSVKTHVRLAYDQLGARDRAHAIAICLVRGLIHPHEIELCPPKTRQESA